MGNLAENLVSGPRAEQVVDRLEAIDIGKADRKGSRIAGALFSQVADGLAELARISKPGQRIDRTGYSRWLLADTMIWGFA
ncbi:hypothetical protein D9M72_653110 [compost metagenome]